MSNRVLAAVAAASLACASAIIAVAPAHAAGTATASANGTTVTVKTRDIVTGWDSRRALWPENIDIAVTTPADFVDTTGGSVRLEPVEWQAVITSMGAASCSFTKTIWGTGTSTKSAGVYGVQQTSSPGTCSVSVRVLASRDTKLAAGDYFADVTAKAAPFTMRAAPVYGTRLDEKPKLSAKKVAKGKAVKVSGMLRENWDFTHPAVAKGVVRLQFRATGSQRWTDVAQTTTTSKGAWSMKHKPQSSGKYRAYFPGNSRVLAGASPAASIKVTAAKAKKAVKVSKPKLASSVKRGKTVTISGKVTGAKSGKKMSGLKSKVTVQFKANGTSYWVNVKTVKSNGAGSWKVKTKLKNSGKVRAVHKATNTYKSAKSPVAKVRVR